VGQINQLRPVARTPVVTHNPFSGGQEVVHLLGGDGALELLTVQQPRFDPLKTLAGLDELFGALAVSSTVASLAREMTA
jgi:hypothetical protein